MKNGGSAYGPTHPRNANESIHGPPLTGTIPPGAFAAVARSKSIVSLTTGAATNSPTPAFDTFHRR